MSLMCCLPFLPKTVIMCEKATLHSHSQVLYLSFILCQGFIIVSIFCYKQKQIKSDGSFCWRFGAGRPACRQQQNWTLWWPTAGYYLHRCHMPQRWAVHLLLPLLCILRVPSTHTLLSLYCTQITESLMNHIY